MFARSGFESRDLKLFARKSYCDKEQQTSDAESQSSTPGASQLTGAPSNPEDPTSADGHAQNSQQSCASSAHVFPLEPQQQVMLGWCGSSDPDRADPFHSDTESCGSADPDHGQSPHSLERAYDNTEEPAAHVLAPPENNSTDSDSTVIALSHEVKMLSEYYKDVCEQHKEDLYRVTATHEQEIHRLVGIVTGITHARACPPLNRRRSGKREQDSQTMGLGGY